MESPVKTKRPQSRLARTLRSLAYISLFGIALASYNAFNLNRDTQIATGATGDGQKAFFVEAADRPDMPVFYKGLTPEQRLAIAKNVANYDDPKIPKLIGVLLADFDANARAELSKSMDAVAPKQPKAVAEQLTLKGSFQRLAVFEALRKVEDEALPHVVEMLSNGDARPNAIAFLVEAGPKSIPLLLPKLEVDDRDVRVAAADALGKLRAEAAVDRLVQLYEQSEKDVAEKPDDQPTIDARATYMTALAGIASQRSRQFLSQIAQNPSIAPSLRSQASLGLGKLGDDASAKILWQLASSDEPEIRDGALSALRVAGDVALNTASADSPSLLYVAAGVQTPKADAIISRYLKDPLTSVEAARASAGRLGLVSAVKRQIELVNPTTNGDLADALVQALAATEEGRAILTQMTLSPELQAIVDRRIG